MRALLLLFVAVLPACSTPARAPEPPPVWPCAVLPNRLQCHAVSLNGKGESYDRKIQPADICVTPDEYLELMRRIR